MRQRDIVGRELLVRFTPGTQQATRLTENPMRVAIVGGDPAGLLLAWKLLALGHMVYVFEQRGPYELSQDIDGRSYNLTADGLGLKAFGPLSRLMYSIGTIIDGRAIHRESNDVYTHPYGYRVSDHLVSIARSDLLTLLTATIRKHSNCKLNFNSLVDHANVDEGSVGWLASKRKKTKKKEKKRGFLKKLDLIAFADGINGIGQQQALMRAGKQYYIEPHGTPYLKVTISANAAKENGLRLDKIHFFPARACLAIGLPNIDGTISTLIEHQLRIDKNGVVETEYSPFVEGNRPWNWEEPVFNSKEEAQAYFLKLNKHLQKLLKRNFLQQVIPDGVKGMKPGAFYESSFKKWRVGAKGVLVGDAGACAPPWAGFGMNLACSHAADLANCISEAMNIDHALDDYNKRRQGTSNVVKEIIEEHGKLLNSGIGSDEWIRLQEAREKKERDDKERTKYQIVAFDEGGLERLAGLQ